MKIPISLPNTDERIRKELRYLLFVQIFSDISMKGLCKQAGIQPKQLNRSYRGECSYRSQTATALQLIATLPYKVTDELITEANTLLDEIEKLSLQVFELDGESYE
ncbi:hypothetical protein [Bacillus cereus group sp. MG6]|uniref:hypothetical protein n=1 Tax=Bacillus cereus group sp. MG6 TaxID=3040246 RepID=UPI0033937AE3